MSAFGSAKCCCMSDTPPLAGPNQTPPHPPSRASFMEPLIRVVIKVSSDVLAAMQTGATGASATKPLGKVTLKTSAPFKCCWQARPTSDKKVLQWIPTEPLEILIIGISVNFPPSNQAPIFRKHWSVISVNDKWGF